ncbi:hypothetical protein PHLCEN_2v12898 [Hermanssonia centrifuga]|uniref:NADH:flavin oxidoreductase/NADH oxidase N-terminal domain-containing protein n=1 Tax=Hermanssonia centrifuga TaxID=98765 RepID=A0A2R6NFS6_9APHY|nr:hypothetical protein PHLCEN_2v12898 [Hermanssonia centrifuga]
MSSSTVLAPYISSQMQLGDLTLKNRNIMSSLTRSRSFPDAVPNKYNVEYYTQRAKGGAGLIITEGTLVSQQGTEWPDAPGIWNEGQVKGWKKVTDSVHKAGGLIFCQLMHTGRLAHPDMEAQKKSGKPVVGPSAIAARGGQFRQLPDEPGYVVPTPLEDPQAIVQEFRHAATMAKKAGFDGVEFHSAYGHLPQQFLDSSSNQRTDEWGGSPENRSKFGIEVVKALIEVWGPGRVGIKVNPCGGLRDVGMSLPDTLMTYTYYLSRLSALKPAYITLVRYAPFLDHVIPGSATQTKRGTPHKVLAFYGPIIKPPAHVLKSHSEQAFRGPAMPNAALNSLNPTPTRLFVNGALTPREADELIAKGMIDGVVFGCLWLGNPDLQKRIEKGMDVDGKGINQVLDFKTLYGAPGVDPRVGYTDYPTVT